MNDNGRPECIIEMKVEPKSKADSGRLLYALAQIASENLTLRYILEPESGEIAIRAVSEVHLESMMHVLEQKFGIPVNVGAPHVAYRETLARAVEADHTHKKQTGETGQFARVKLRLEPSEPGAGNEFESEIAGDVVPLEYIPGVEKGVRAVWASGVLVGFPMVDMKVTLYDGAYHEVDSSAITFEIAARQAMREGCDRAGVKLLEPIMDVEVVTPGDFVGSVIGDINRRRGQMRSQEMRGNATVMRANVPLAHLFDYASGLRAATNGKGTYTMNFSHFEKVPPNTQGPDDFPPAVGMRA